MIKLLFNPFEKFSEKTLFVFGIAITLIGSYLGYVFNGRYDGVIDLHFSDHVTLQQPFIDNAINIFSLFLFLYVCGKFINKKTRFIDILNPVLIARIPFYLLTFFNSNGYISNLTERMLSQFDFKNPPTELHLETVDLIVISIFSILAIAFLVWFVVLLYKGFKIATNSKKPSHIAYFILSILLAEITSGFLISSLTY